MPGNRPYSRKELNKMNRRNLLDALRRRSGGQFTDAELSRLRELGGRRQDIEGLVQSQSGSQYTDEEFRRRSRTRAGRRNRDNERRGLDALRRESGAQFTDAEFKRRASRRIGGKQGYNDREDESLGMRRGPERNYSQSMKDRRDESYGRWGTRDARRRRGGR